MICSRLCFVCQVINPSVCRVLSYKRRPPPRSRSGPPAPPWQGLAERKCPRSARTHRHGHTQGGTIQRLIITFYVNFCKLVCCIITATCTLVHYYRIKGSGHHPTCCASGADMVADWHHSPSSSCGTCASAPMALAMPETMPRVSAEADNVLFC